MNEPNALSSQRCLPPWFQIHRRDQDVPKPGLVRKIIVESYGRCPGYDLVEAQKHPRITMQVSPAHIEYHGRVERDRAFPVGQKPLSTENGEVGLPQIAGQYGSDYSRRPATCEDEVRREAPFLQLAEQDSDAAQSPVPCLEALRSVELTNTYGNSLELLRAWVFKKDP